MLMVSGAAVAQNNTGYPSGTKCGDLIEPRRSACNDAFDPRPNPREIINKPAQKPLLPRKVPSLGQPVLPTNPKSSGPKSSGSVPPPILKGPIQTVPLR